MDPDNLQIKPRRSFLILVVDDELIAERKLDLQRIVVVVLRSDFRAVALDRLGRVGDTINSDLFCIRGVMIVCEGSGEFVALDRCPIGNACLCRIIRHWSTVFVLRDTMVSVS